MIENSVEICNNIFWIGSSRLVNGLNTNIYLLNDGDDSILFGAGSAVDFDLLFSNITDIIKISKLRYIILQDHDSSLCSGITFFEKNGFTGKIITHLNLSSYIKYYGIRSEIVYSNLTANRLFLKSGRVIRFFNTPYLKSAGSFSAYDTISGTLFSGDLFGSSSTNWSLYAGENYYTGMKKYHSEYMPDQNILRYIIDIIVKNNISIIAPQHGSIIKDNIPEAILSLMDTPCGSIFAKMKLNTDDLNNKIISICNGFLKRYYLLFSSDEVLEIFKESGIVIDKNTGFIMSYESGITNLWNHFFEIIVSKKGYKWLSLIENDLHRIICEQKIEYPDIFNSSIYKLEQRCEKIEKEKIRLLDDVHSMETKLESNAAKDPLAQVYKEDMFKENLLSDIAAFRDIGIEFAFFIIEIDNLPQLNIRFGRDAGDELLANTAYLLKNFKKTSKNYAHHLIFRMNGPRFTYYCTDVTQSEIITIAEEVRTEFRESKLFITNITISAGVIHSSEFSMGDRDPSELSAAINEVANSRLRLARHKGVDSVCSESETNACFDRENYIMVIDPDISVRYLLETHLTRAGFNVETCAMGDEALQLIDINKPLVIISELMLPKMDGFSLRKKMLEDSSLKDIGFILTSAVKDETSITRAHSLGIYHYYKKPYSIIELIGLVKNLSEEKV